MLTVNLLALEEINTLEEMHKNHPCHAARLRAHAILLSDTGFKLKEIVSIFTICRQTAATWLHAWRDGGICALFDKPRSGRPPILCNEAEADAISRVNQSPRSLKKVLAELTASLNLTVTPSISTLKRMCKRAELSWKRVRKSLRSKRDPDLFDQSRQQLAALIEQSKQQEIDLFYFDESGFTLEPCVPYAWQPRCETIEVPCAKSKRLNVLGFVNRECSFTSVVFEGSVTSAVVVASIDHFISTLQRQTVLVMDNASVHKSYEFQENILLMNRFEI